ncbi:MAG: hypothetical protein ABIF88_03930 [archaeon]
MSIKNKVIGGLVVLGITAGVAYWGISPASNRYEKLFEEGKRPIVGTVLEEVYQNTLSPVPSRNGFVSYSNETVKLESKYTLKIQTDDGRILGVSVIDVDGKDDDIPIKKESLDVIIEKGSKISFPAGNMRDRYYFSEHKKYSNETYFTPETRAGNKRADRITVLPKE